MAAQVQPVEAALLVPPLLFFFFLERPAPGRRELSCAGRRCALVYIGATAPALKLQVIDRGAFQSCQR